MEERRQSQRRIAPDRRKGARTAWQIPVGTGRPATRERRKGERRVIADRREYPTKLTCPVCQGNTVGFDLMLSHLIEVHKISSRQAMILTKKMAEWKQEKLDPTLFP